MKARIDARTARQIVRDHLAKAGAKGGASTSQAKARAARENGKKGGKPKRIKMWCPICGKQKIWIEGKITGKGMSFRCYKCQGCGNSEDAYMIDVARCS